MRRIEAILIVILMVILASGCNVKRWCYEQYPPVEKTDTVRIIDTFELKIPVAIPIPSDTVRLYDTVYIEEAGGEFIDTLKTDFAISLCGWTDGILFHEIYNRDVIIRDTVYVPMFNEMQIITTDKIHKVQVTPWWHKYVLIIMLIIIVILLFRR